MSFRNMNNKAAKALLLKYDSGKCTEEEKALLESWFIQMKAAQQPHVLPEDVLEADLIAVWNTINEHTPMVLTDNKDKIRKPISKLWIAAAAILLLVMGTGIWFLKQEDPGLRLAAGNSIQPAKNKAMLTLNNGTKISLSQSKTGIVINPSSLTYDDGAPIGNTTVVDSEMAIIQTPSGGYYTVLLPDGSKVILNTASSLTFPLSFSGLVSRKVELKGEAYFEITKNKIPFIVVTDKQEVEVLGTHFNINSYADEPGIKTTLEEGSVKIRAHGNEHLLKPGEQAENIGKILKIRRVNMELELDWKNDDFALNGEDLKSVMRKIGRWYDVEVVYDPSVPTDIEPGGWISRNNKLSTVLKRIESSGQVHFKVEGRRIMVTK
jgi:transmembrane sensor